MNDNHVIFFFFLMTGILNKAETFEPILESKPRYLPDHTHVKGIYEKINIIFIFS